MGDERNPIARVPSYIEEIKRQLEKKNKLNVSVRKPPRKSTDAASKAGIAAVRAAARIVLLGLPLGCLLLTACATTTDPLYRQSLEAYGLEPPKEESSGGSVGGFLDALGSYATTIRSNTPRGHDLSGVCRPYDRQPGCGR
jgi:hypothetical protein